MEVRTTVTLPFDILLYITDLLAGENDEGIKSLRFLSQACKSMVPLCRKHIFSSLRLNNELSSRFSDLLSKNPDIARYVRSLNYRAWKPISDHVLHILDVLKERSSLQSIVLSTPGLSWNDFPESIRSSLVSLIELPTVVNLNIDGFDWFPATALSGCSNLNDLELKELELAPPEVNYVILRNKIPTPTSLYIKKKAYSFAALLNSASLHAGGPIVDFSRLKRVLFEVECRGDIDQVNELIKVSTQLEYFYMSTCICGE